MSAVSDEQKIRVLTNGPYAVRGGVPLARTAQVETEYGEPIDWEPLEPIDVETPDNYQLCRCGHTENRPFCDDTCEGDFDGSQAVMHRCLGLLAGEDAFDAHFSRALELHGEVAVRNIQQDRLAADELIVRPVHELADLRRRADILDVIGVPERPREPQVELVGAA